MRHGNLALFVPHLGCPHRCSFCDQRAITGVQRLPTPEDVCTLCKEAAQKTGRSLELAFFGGSFTCIDRQSLLSLLEAARPFLGAGISGIRISTRPDAVEGEMLSLLKARGVTAIELGAQSMSDAVLKKNGRGHSARDVAEAAERVRGFGFELGLQMMLGLDGAEESDDLATARALMPAARIPSASIRRWCCAAPGWRSGCGAANTAR
ncbi:radical SAM protein [Yanshouia hominis]|uniref:Radical SAM protein n=1 Tax=Yanshouia hominis TaxID=2763673 RepID=A0ABR7NHX1_9FIRM|nr:radical SAM protein [Yanshouia hominis]MBC8576006.1 radical SAM protein [Yanshouia hominis]